MYLTPFTIYHLPDLEEEINPFHVEGSYCHGVPEHVQWAPSEPADPTGGRLPGVLLLDWPSPSFQSADALLPHEEVVVCPTGKVIAFTMGLHP